jgi:hypothetical protein
MASYPSRDNNRLFRDSLDRGVDCDASVRNGAVSTDFPTLQDAIIAWHRLRPEQAQRASIRIIGGELYAAAQIPKLLDGSKPSRD